MMRCDCCNFFLVYKPILFKLFAAHAGAWVAVGKVIHGEIVTAELADRRGDRSSCSQAGVWWRDDANPNEIIYSGAVLA